MLKQVEVENVYTAFALQKFGDYMPAKMTVWLLAKTTPKREKQTLRASGFSTTLTTE